MKKYGHFLFILPILFVASFFLSSNDASAVSAVSTVAAKIPVPQADTEYSLGYLKSLINTNNPANTSNFLIALSGQRAIPDNELWNMTKPTGSGSASRVGMTLGWITAHKNIKVTLKVDEELISYLQSTGHLLSGDADEYQKILLYFEYQIKEGGPAYRFYLNDPFPGLIRSVITKVGTITQKKTVNPAQDIINKWDV